VPVTVPPDFPFAPSAGPPMPSQIRWPYRGALQNTGVRTTSISFGSFVWGMLNREDMGNYIFALLAKNGYAVEKVQVKRGTLTAWQGGGTVNAAATATINGADSNLNLTITLQ
jgi:hypothetical protein